MSTKRESYHYLDALPDTPWTWVESRHLKGAIEFRYYGGRYHGFPYPLTSEECNKLCELYNQLTAKAQRRIRKGAQK